MAVLALSAHTFEGSVVVTTLPYPSILNGRLIDFIALVSTTFYYAEG